MHRGLVSSVHVSSVEHPGIANVFRMAVRASVDREKLRGSPFSGMLLFGVTAMSRTALTAAVTASTETILAGPSELVKIQEHFNSPHPLDTRQV